MFMKRRLLAMSAAVALAITLVAPVSAAAKMTFSACATSSGALQTTLTWSGIAVTSYGIGILDGVGNQFAGDGSGGFLDKPLRHYQWMVTTDILASSVGSVIGGGFDAKAGAPIALTVVAPFAACPAAGR